jgi:hypothetical protein
MKAKGIVIVAVGFGCCIAFWLFALAFTRSLPEFNRASLVPLAAVFVVSLVLVVVQPTEAKSVVVAMSLPTLLCNSFLFMKLLEGGRSAEWGHITSALKVIGAALGGALIGYFVQRKNHSSDA